MVKFNFMMILTKSILLQMKKSGGLCCLFMVINLMLTAQQGYNGRPGSLGITGDTADVTTATQAGYVLAGGGTDVDAAMQWLLKRSGGGDVVILRSSGGTGYNDYLYKLGKVNSVETLFIDSKALAENDTLVQIVRNAEAVFIAGGNQWNYVNYWKGTALNKALNELILHKKIPIGGTSAGLAILGGYYFDAEKGSISSEEALQDPFDPKLSIGQDFLNIPLLRNLLTDSHYDARNRQGRHLAMLSQIYAGTGKAPMGLGIDEKTAVCLDGKGKLTVYGSGKAWFLMPGKQLPEIRETKKTLTWNQGGIAVKSYTIDGSKEGIDGGSLKNSKRMKNGKSSYFVVIGGKFMQL